MFAKIRNSWALIKASAGVLRADKELIVFPIVSAIGVLLVTASFALPMLFAGFFDALFEGRSQIFGVVVGFVFYVVQYFVIIFANSALVGAAMIRLRGGSSIGGLAWNLATYLVVPVLVIEDVGPLEAVRRSANLLKKTWGEQIVGNFSIGLIFGLLTVLVILLAIPTFIFIASTNSVAIIALAAVLFVLIFVFLGLISSTLNGIYVAAVYRYAAEGEASGFFSEEMVRGAFRPK
jgi:hypothetical protein